LRPATSDDAKLLFDWVNSPDSLENKLTTAGPIDWAGHQQWLERLIADPDCLLQIVECDGRPVGQVRLESKEGGVHVDVFLLPEFRGAGIARDAVRRTIDALGRRPVIALVRRSNARSLALFRALGFDRIDADGGVLTFRLEH